MRKKWTIVLVTYLASLLLVVGLYANAYFQLRKTNSFIRLFPPHMLGKQHRIDVGTNAFYIAGIHQDTLYLSNRLDARWLKKVSLSNLDTTDLILSWPTMQPPFSDWQVSLQNEILSFSNYLTGTLLLSSYPFHQPYFKAKLAQPFYKTLPIHPSLLFAKSYNTPLQSRSIVRLTLDQSIPQQAYLPPKKPDGLYSTDGILLWNATYQNLLYLHNFVNTVTILDSTCNVQYSHNTIDLVDSIKGSIIRQQQKGIQIQQVETSLNNSLATTDQHLVLVYSKAPASNQSLARFRKNATIDIYQLPTFRYLYSFYLPLTPTTTLLDLQLYNQHLYALTGTELIQYQLLLPSAR